MANMFGDSNERATKVGKIKEPTPTPVQIEVRQESKQEGKSCGFYLSYEAIDLLDDFARKNRCSKSKALDTLILQVLK